MKKNSDFSILIVDDEILNIKIASVYLKREGYRVFYTTNPLSALKNVTQQEINLILLDIDMPQKDGFEVCELLKKDKATKDIPIIFLTAQTDIEYISRAFKIGGVDYIFKPFNPTELKVRIKTHLQIVSYLQEIKDKQYKLALHSFTDPLTKLNNSLYFDSQLMNNINKNKKFWILVFKIDRLDRANHLYGLFGADAIIKSFAKLIKNESKENAIVARLHGGSIGVIVNSPDKKAILDFYKSVVLKAFKDENIAHKITFSTILYYIKRGSISLPYVYKKIHNNMHMLQQTDEHKYLIIQ